MSEKNEKNGEKKNGKKARQRHVLPVSAEDFVKIWQKSETIEDAAKSIGVTNRTVLSVRAAYLRKVGVKLKHMPKGRGRLIDVEKLNKIATAK